MRTYSTILSQQYVATQRSRVGFFLLLLVLALSGWAQESSNSVPAQSINSVAALAPAPVSLAAETPVAMFTPRNGRWVNTLLKQVTAGDEFISANHLYRQSDVCTFLLPDIDVNKLADADGAYNQQNYRWPTASDVVMVLDAQMKFMRHAVLGTLQPGIRICFQGKAYDLRAGRTAGTMDLIDTGIVSSRVTQTFKHKADTLVDLTVRSEDGKESIISGTPQHLFFVPAIENYVPMGDLAIGTMLQNIIGSTVTVVSSKVRHGNFDVYNLEVKGQHNYFVSDKKVLVHNDCLKFLHDFDLIKIRSGYKFWSNKSTAEIIESLKPGLKDSLKVYDDGTIADGNSRLLVLAERGVDISQLPREVIQHIIAPGYWD